MRRLRTMAIALELFASFMACGAASAQVKVPDTPAGHMLQAWLAAVNGGKLSKAEAYIKSSAPKLDALYAFLFIANPAREGGFDLLSVDASSDSSILFRVKGIANAQVSAGVMKLEKGRPATVKTLVLLPMPSGAVIDDIALDAQRRRLVIDGAAAALQDLYVFPDSAQKMADALSEHVNGGDYDAIADGTDFAALLTEHLRAVSHDKHLRVTYEPFRKPAGSPEPGAAGGDAHGCGFEKTEILPGNIGYLKFNMFADSATCESAASAAIHSLARADAIIFDLRENFGGSSEMVVLLSSYLFQQPVHLTDIYVRKGDDTSEIWTRPVVPGASLPDTPILILTSKNTISAAEDFSYNLKVLQRATIVGETTAGAAHLTRVRRIDDRFVIKVPFARSINPVSKTNWEGTGVEPDIPVKASDALGVAIKLAAGKIQRK